MATPYFQLRVEHVPSTQDVARAELEDLPVLVIAAGQTHGRGRSGAEWLNADRALAVSLAYGHDPEDRRPVSLMAGVAAVRSVERATLKWPNDVLVDGAKVGGILVERSDGVTVVGLGLNLLWPDAPEGAAAIFEADPGENAHVEIAALWGAELMELLDSDGWPRSAYRDNCETIGRHITWEPDGSGRAVDVDEDGGLVVETPEGQETLHSGAVRHIR